MPVSVRLTWFWLSKRGTTEEKWFCRGLFLSWSKFNESDNVIVPMFWRLGYEMSIMARFWLRIQREEQLTKMTIFNVLHVQHTTMPSVENYATCEEQTRWLLDMHFFFNRFVSFWFVSFISFPNVTTSATARRTTVWKMLVLESMSCLLIIDTISKL